jgi:hypothetical protein
MRWAELVARMREVRNAHIILVEKPKGKKHSQDLGIDGRIVLEFIVEKCGGKLWTGFIWLRRGPVAG